MKVCLLILTLSLFAFGLQNPSSKSRIKTFDFASQIGVASLNPAEQLCLRVKNSNLTVGEELTLVSFATPQAIFRAKIVEKLDQAYSSGDVSGEDNNYYRVEVTKGKIDASPPLIAIVKSDAQFLRSKSGVGVDLNRDGLLETFKSCASSEGLHLTVWSGKPLAGKRQWYTYYYLGYDMKGDCTRKETREQ